MEIQAELVQVAAAGAEPIALADAKAWLRVEFTDDDTLIGGLISAARAHAENFCRRSFQSGDQYTLTLNRFPLALRSGEQSYEVPFVDYAGNYLRVGSTRPRLFSIEIPLGPVSAINSVTYYDTTGTQQTLSPAKYELIQSDDANPLLYPTTQLGNFWPATQVRPDAVTLTFTAGGLIAPPVLLAMKQMMAHWYTNRESVTLTGKPATVPQTAEMLLWPYRLLEL